MNIKHQLKRQLRDAEAALAPFISRLASEGSKVILRKGQNGSSGFLFLSMQAPSNPEIAGLFVERIAGSLSELGLHAEHETFPIDGSVDEVGVVFEMTFRPPASSH